MRSTVDMEHIDRHVALLFELSLDELTSSEDGDSLGELIDVSLHCKSPGLIACLLTYIIQGTALGGTMQGTQVPNGTVYGSKTLCFHKQAC